MQSHHDPTEVHPYRVVQPWMGAWYTLREGDPVAMANREKLKGRRPPTRVVGGGVLTTSRKRGL